MPSAIEVAFQFVRFADDELEPAPITPLQVQKLLYYAQGLSLAFRKRPLFPEDIQAWEHGPVVPDVWQKFACLRGASIQLSHDFTINIDQEDQEFLAAVWEHYRKYSANQLRRMTHREPPWLEARQGLSTDSPSQRRIPADRIRDYFVTFCNERLQERSGLTLEDFQEAEADVANGRVLSLTEVKKRLEESA